MVDAVQSTRERLSGTKVERLAARSLDLAIWKAAVRRRTGRGRTAAVELRCMPGLFSQDDPLERNALASAKRADHSPRDHARLPTLTPARLRSAAEIQGPLGARRLVLR